MLDFLRKRRRSWVLTFLLGLIVVVFVLFYGGGSLREPRLEKVAEVNGEVISQREFAPYYQKLIEYYRQLFKGALTPEAIKNLNLKSVVLSQLVRRHLLLQEARRLGLEVGDEELMDAIARMPEFHVGGQFNRNRYLQVLRSTRLSPGEFETDQRERLTTEKLYSVIQEAVHVTENEVREQYRVEQERVNFYFIRLSAGDFVSQTEIRPEEIQNYYERNKEALREPLKAQVEYLLYPFEHFSSKVQVSQREIEDFYKLNLEKRFRQPKAVRVRHMFFRPPAAKDPQEKAQHRLRAEGVLQELRAGKDFAELAKKYSEDPSAAQGGDIGWIAQGQILPPLEQAAFAMRKGEVSGLVETPLGYHILKVEEIREEKSKGLKETTEEIIRSIRAERGKSEAGKAVDADRDRGLSGTDLSLLAKERGISYKVTPLFGLTEVVPEVGPVEEFNKAAFSLAPREVSPAIEGPSAYYLLRGRQRKEPTIPPLESVGSQIEKGLREMRALELASQKANAVLAQMKKEKEIQKVAKGHGLKVEETGWFLRHNPEIPKVGVLQEVKPGGIAISLYQPIADRIYTQKSSVYLFTFKESQGADMERFEREKGELLERALTEKRQRILKGFVEHLKAKARIEVQPKFLEEG